MTEMMDEFEAFRQKKLAEREAKKRAEARAHQAAQQEGAEASVALPGQADDGPVLAFVPTEDRGDAPALAAGYESHACKRSQEIEIPPPPDGIERIEAQVLTERPAAPPGLESHRHPRERGGEVARPAGFESHRYADIPAEEVSQPKPEGFESGRFDR